MLSYQQETLKYSKVAYFAVVLHIHNYDWIKQNTKDTYIIRYFLLDTISSKLFYCSLQIRRINLENPLELKIFAHDSDRQRTQLSTLFQKFYLIYLHDLSMHVAKHKGFP